MKITHKQVVIETTTIELIRNLMTSTCDIANDTPNDEELKGIWLNLASEVETIATGDVAKLFREGMTFMLLPRLDEHSDLVDDEGAVIYIADRDVTIANEDIVY
jgi:hypothetical protein